MESTRREFLAAISVSPLAAAFPWLEAPHGSDEYLFTPGLIYLNTASLGPCTRRVIEATQRAWYALESDPVTMAYGEGATLAAAEHVRQTAANFLGCNTEEIMLTRSTTDGMNAVAQGLRLGSGDRVLTTDQEHEGGLAGWLYLAKHQGVAIDVVNIPSGEHDAARIVQRFADALTPRTRVISVSHILSSTGLRMPIAEIAKLAESRGILCVVDGAQSAGGIEVNVKQLGCHAYATSGHKWLMAPKGTGILYVAKGSADRIKPMQFDDGRAYYNHSSGVGNLPGVIGLGVALEALQATGMAAVEQHNLHLRNALFAELKRMPKLRVLSAPPGDAATQLVTFMLPDNVDSQVLTRALREKHAVVVKMVPKRWLNGIRLSPHIFNTERDIGRALEALRSELT